MQKVIKEDEVKIKTVTEKVTVQQIPRMIAETMSLQQLEHLALTRGLILPEFIKEE
jgi:hypothetical protein